MCVGETVLELNGEESAVEELKKSGDDSPENMTRFEMNLKDTRYMRNNCFMFSLTILLYPQRPLPCNGDLLFSTC